MTWHPPGIDPPSATELWWLMRGPTGDALRHAAETLAHLRDCLAREALLNNGLGVVAYAEELRRAYEEYVAEIERARREERESPVAPLPCCVCGLIVLCDEHTDPAHAACPECEEER